MPSPCLYKASEGRAGLLLFLMLCFVHLLLDVLFLFFTLLLADGQGAGLLLFLIPSSALQTMFLLLLADGQGAGLERESVQDVLAVGAEGEVG